MENSEVYSNLIKDCFWDYNVSEEKIRKIVQSDDFRQKQFLFSKIIYNSTDKARTLSVLFNRETLKRLFSAFKIEYNRRYISKCVLLLRNILLDEDNYIESLAWKKR